MNDSHEILIEWIKIEAIKRFGDNQNYTENDNEIKKMAEEFNNDFVNMAKELKMFSLNGKKLLLYSGTVEKNNKKDYIYNILNSVIENIFDYKIATSIEMNDFYNDSEEIIIEIFENLELVFITKK